VPGTDGGPPIWPAGASTFCALTAEIRSVTVSSSLAMRSGLIQTRMA
jgi:hypothetical protein